jgi:hypothetical protein
MEFPTSTYAEKYGYIEKSHVKALRELCKPRKIRVVWDKTGKVNLYFPIRGKLSASTYWNLKDIYKAIESGEIY